MEAEVRRRLGTLGKLLDPGRRQGPKSAAAAHRMDVQRTMGRLVALWTEQGAPVPAAAFNALPMAVRRFLLVSALRFNLQKLD
jgi:hypothetical protein